MLQDVGVGHGLGRKVVVEIDQHPLLERGFLARIAENPKVTMLYRNPGTRLAFQIHGEARHADDDATKQRVYDHSPENERNQDPERKGTAVVVDVVRLIQGGKVVQSRD